MVMDYLDFCEVILTWSVFNPNQKEKLQDLYEMVDNYDYYLDERTKTDDVICNDLEWHKIRTFAKEVYDDLKQVKYVPNKND